MSLFDIFNFDENSKTNIYNYSNDIRTFDSDDDEKGNEISTCEVYDIRAPTQWEMDDIGEDLNEIFLSQNNKKYVLTNEEKECRKDLEVTFLRWDYEDCDIQLYSHYDMDVEDDSILSQLNKCVVYAKSNICVSDNVMNRREDAPPPLSAISIMNVSSEIKFECLKCKAIFATRSMKERHQKKCTSKKK